MKRIPLSLLLIFLSAGIFGQEKESRYQDKEIPEINLSTEEWEGKAKAGVALGYPTGFTFGYRPANYLEINVFAGTHRFDGFTLGTSVLFTVVQIRIKEELLPLSVGPALYSEFGGDFRMAGGMAFRWEYTFREVPLNLYIEAVPGVSFVEDFGFYLASSLGVRYVF